MSPQRASQLTPLQRRTFQPDEWPRKKTVDIGRNGVSVSADPLGGIYQVSSKIEDPRYAMMIAAPWQQFDQKHRQNPLVVREYRKHMEKRLESRQRGLGIKLGIDNGPVIITHIKDSRGNQVRFDYQDRRQELFVQTTIQVQDHGHIIQAHQVTNTGSKTQRGVPILLDLSFAISRASYGQLTDQGEVAMPQRTNLVKIHTGANRTPVASIENESLGARLTARVFFYNSTRQETIQVNHQLFPFPGQDEKPPSRLLEQRPYEQSVQIPPGETVHLICELRPEDISLATLAGGKTPNLASSASSFSFFHENHLANPKSFGKNLVAQRFVVNKDIIEPTEIVQRHLIALTGVDTTCSKLDTTESCILFANVNYIVGCCCLPMATPDSQSWAVIPDHIALPLGWPRDNYWQLRLLSKFYWRCSEPLFPKQDGNPDDKAQEYRTQLLSILRGHLTWLFEVAVIKAEVRNETRHFWRRSYLINGLPKDGIVYQLDTQLYPFLQLCEFYNDFGKDVSNHQAANRKLVEKLVRTETFSNVLLDVLSRQDTETGLFKTDETPADDDSSDYPFHLSSNILAWHTMRQLALLLANLRGGRPRAAIDSQSLVHVASEIFNGVNKHLICECQDGSGAQIFAYGLNPMNAEGDPAPRHRQYHDGNDIPTLFAHDWGFLDACGDQGPIADGPSLRAVWEKTMTWAFQPDPNWTVDYATRTRTPGYNTGYAGNGTEPFHGLGSDHSDGAWVLGFFQEWRFAQLVGDRERESRAWEKIQGSMQWDGTFSEAVDVFDGQCTSKTWFSWPGAIIAENLIATVVGQAHEHAEGPLALSLGSTRKA